MSDDHLPEDARFEDAGDKPLNLGAFDADDMSVISALVQDAVFSVSDIRWERGRRRLALLINRLRREDGQGRNPPERVRSLLVFDGVSRVSSQGIDRRESALVLSLLSLEFEPADPPGGAVLLTLAGDGAIRADVEALEVNLRDVTRPYLAPSGKTPDHDL